MYILITREGNSNILPAVEVLKKTIEFVAIIWGKLSNPGAKKVDCEEASGMTLLQR
jgi:hypothetical protein